jgi:leader peptidase (prepilin peptidase)/N-methyltransferase
MAGPSLRLHRSAPAPAPRRARLTHVQFAAGVAVVACFLALSPAEAVIASVGSAALVVIAANDIRRRLIPNRIVLPATAGALALRVLLKPDTAASYTLAALALAAVLVAPRLMKRDALGMGDVKLGLLVGAMLGWAGFAALAIAFLAMFPFAAAVLVRGGRAARGTGLPFAPFFAFGSALVLFGSGL